ncbi:MAG TPA: hypothetical protein VGH00_01710 [Chthoniobacterales bacterium]|jgi:hypothetical protein
MKPDASRQTAPREIFVLTPDEKRTISFVLVMFLLGLTTAHYRAIHSIRPAATAVRETAKSAALRAQKRAESKHAGSLR